VQWLRPLTPRLERYVHALVLLVFLAVAAYPGSSSGQTSLCQSDEQDVWSCSTARKTYSICASRDLDGSSGYMQYRVGKPSAIEFSFPEDLKHPRGVFEFSVLAKGVSLAFENKGFEYGVYESVMGGATIVVSQKGRELSTIQCDTSTETLTLTTTINQMKAVGIVE